MNCSKDKLTGEEKCGQKDDKGGYTEPKMNLNTECV